MKSSTSGTPPRSWQVVQDDGLAFAAPTINRHAADVMASAEEIPGGVLAVPNHRVPSRWLTGAIDKRPDVEGEMVPDANEHLLGVGRQRLADGDRAIGPGRGVRQGIAVGRTDSLDRCQHRGCMGCFD